LPVPRDEGTDLQWRNTADRYGLIGQALHWLVAIGIVAPGMVRPAAVSSAESEQESARRAARNPLQPAGRAGSGAHPGGPEASAHRSRRRAA